MAERVVLHYFKLETGSFFKFFVKESYCAQQAGIDKINEYRGFPVDCENTLGLLQEGRFRDYGYQLLFLLLSGAGKQQSGNRNNAE